MSTLTLRYVRRLLPAPTAARRTLKAYWGPFGFSATRTTTNWTARNKAIRRRIKITGTTTSTQEHTIAKARVVTNIAQNQPIKAVIGVLKKESASTDAMVTKAAIAAISAAISIGIDLPIYAQLPSVFVIQLNTRESTGPAISKAAKKLPRNPPRVKCTTCVGGVSASSTPLDRLYPSINALVNPSVKPLVNALLRYSLNSITTAIITPTNATNATVAYNIAINLCHLNLRKYGRYLSSL